MPLLTDLIDPAMLTGYTRAALADYEGSNDSLTSHLPNQVVSQNTVSLRLADNGLMDAADFRAYDSELDFGKGEDVDEQVVRLLPIGVKLAISEFEQVAAIGSNEDFLLQAVRRASERAARAVADRMELERGRVISTGKVAFHKSGRPVVEDNFGRDADMSVTAGVLWSAAAAKPLDDLLAYLDAYVAKNGTEPGQIIMSNKALRSLAKADGLRVEINGGGSRAASASDVQAILDGYGLPEVRVYNRKVRRFNASTKRSELVNVLPDDSIFLVPPAGQSNLGATYWGRTLTSTKLNWGIAIADQPGIVAGVSENDEPPVITQVVADAIGQPILANANLAMAAKVL